MPFLSLLSVGLAETITTNFIAHWWFWLYILLLVLYRSKHANEQEPPTKKLRFGHALGVLLATCYLAIGNTMAFQAMKNLTQVQSKIREIVVLDTPDHLVEIRLFFRSCQPFYSSVFRGNPHFSSGFGRRGLGRAVETGGSRL